MLLLQKCQKEASDSFKKNHKVLFKVKHSTKLTQFCKMFWYISASVAEKKKNQLKNFTQLHKQANIKSQKACKH